VSILAIELVQYTKGLTLAEYVVLISLASFAGKDEGQCWPSLETLPDISNVEKKTVVRAIQRLTAPYNLPDPRPLVTIVENKKVKVRNNTYKLNLSLLQELQESRGRVFLRHPQGRTLSVSVRHPLCRMSVSLRHPHRWGVSVTLRAVMVTSATKQEWHRRRRQ